MVDEGEVHYVVYPYLLIFIFLGVQIGQVKKYNDQDGATPLMEEIPND